MFGLIKGLSDKEKQREEAIQQEKLQIRELLLEMHDVSPEQAARTHERFKAFMQRAKLIPFDYRQKATKRARALECEANMREADKLVHKALSLMAREEMKERGSNLAESRRYFAKACSLGVEEEWRKAYQRLVENIMMSGGVQTEGPTRAKPLDTAPKVPNRAKE